MSRYFVRSTIMTVAALCLAAPLSAQGRTAVTTTELDAAVTVQPNANREAIRQLLGTDQARKVASQMGLNPSELSARVAALDQGTVDRLAERVQADDAALAGGASITVTTTAIIIALLVLIVLLVT